MTDADLARWEAAGRAGHRTMGPDISGERILALIAEVRRLRGDLTAIIGMHSCGDECAEHMIERAQIALGDDGTLRWGVPQERTAP